MVSSTDTAFMEMNILFSADDNYARHLGMAMYSIMVHHKDADRINFYIVDNCISEDNKKKIFSLVDLFENSVASFISFNYYQEQLKLDMPWPISMSAYARLFAAELLPSHIQKIIYLDCDMIITNSIYDLWNVDLEGYCVGAVQDQVNSRIKSAVGLDSKQRYFNSGMLLVDLKKWREMNIGRQSLGFIKAHEGRVTHHDQGVLNGLLQGKWKRLPLKYNVMTIHYLMSLSRIKRYFGDAADFYDEKEVFISKNNPIIIHFTPSFTSRPWELNCKHPLRMEYIKVQDDTPWAGTKLEKEKSPWYLKLINWRYRTFPF